VKRQTKNTTPLLNGFFSYDTTLRFSSIHDWYEVLSLLEVADYRALVYMGTAVAELPLRSDFLIFFLHMFFFFFPTKSCPLEAYPAGSSGPQAVPHSFPLAARLWNELFAGYTRLKRQLNRYPLPEFGLHFVDSSRRF